MSEETVTVPVEDTPVVSEVPDTVQAVRAFAAAQRSVGSVKKLSTNPHFRNKYVDLNTLLEALHPALAENNLALLQYVDIINEKPVLITTIQHESGAFLGPFKYPILTKDENDPQKVGAGITYARRFQLMTIFAVPAEDDDGTLAAAPAPVKKGPKDQLKATLKKNGTKPEDFAKMINEKYNKNKVAELTDAQATEMLAELNSSGVDF